MEVEIIQHPGAQYHKIETDDIESVSLKSGFLVNYKLILTMKSGNVIKLQTNDISDFEPLLEACGLELGYNIRELW